MIYAFALLIFLFLFFTILKYFSNWKICTICSTFFTTWSTLLILYWLGYYEEPIVIALFMGMSILAVYYILEESLGLFKFPFLLTTGFLGLFLLNGFELKVFVGIIFVWLFFLFSYLFKAGYVKQLIECCKDL